MAPGALIFQRQKQLPAPVIRALAAIMFVAIGAAQAAQITDDRGLSINFSEPPRRIVSLLPSLTETVCALGQCARLVGVDRYSNYPESVRSLAQVGGGLDPSLEAIAALKPDLVLTATSAPVAGRLQALGFKVLAFEPKNHADVRRVLLSIGHLLGVADAQRIWQGMDAELSAVARSLAPGLRNTRVYFEVSSAPYAAGPTSFIGETLTALGVANVAPAGTGPFPRLNPEYVVRADPDLIMVGDRNHVGLQGRPGWAGMRAIRSGRVCVFSAEQTDVLVRPGPRMAQAATIIAQCLRSTAP